MFTELKKVYDYFQDEESRMIFRQRLLYGLTNDLKYIRDMLLSYRDKNKGYNDFLDILAHPENFRGKEIILFGTGLWGRCLLRWLNHCEIECRFFCDNSKEKIGTMYQGKEVISPDTLLTEHQEAIVLISSERYENEILEQLLSEGFEDKQIVRLAYKKNRMYFDTEIITPEKEEIFIDGGCYDATDSLDFIKWSEGQAKKVYAFEPDDNNCKKCQKVLEKQDSVIFQMEQAGLWSEDTVMTFQDEGNVGSRISTTGSVEVSMKSIDTVVGDDKVTFIKMDIEGAELEALRGARNTILKHHPKLAICLYHKKEDILEIPQYIKELVPGYKLYIRHYSPYLFDTVLYAVFDNHE